MIVKLIKESNDCTGKKIQASEQNIETSDKISRGGLVDCKDLDSLVRYLEQNKFTYDEESGIISCTICTSQEELRRNVNEKNTGYFKVNVNKYNIERFTNPSQQPKPLCHLKSHIAEHLFGAQVRDIRVLFIRSSWRAAAGRIQKTSQILHSWNESIQNPIQ